MKWADLEPSWQCCVPRRGAALHRSPQASSDYSFTQDHYRFPLFQRAAIHFCFCFFGYSNFPFFMYSLIAFFCCLRHQSISQSSSCTLNTVRWTMTNELSGLLSKIDHSNVSLSTLRSKLNRLINRAEYDLKTWHRNLWDCFYRLTCRPWSDLLDGLLWIWKVTGEPRPLRK